MLGLVSRNRGARAMSSNVRSTTPRVEPHCRTDCQSVSELDGSAIRPTCKFICHGPIAAMLLLLVVGADARAQTVPRDAAPGREYFLAFHDYYRGDYGDAAEQFRRAARNGVVSGLGRWVDAICYHTMLGECYFHMGESELALGEYDSALRIFLAQKDWMIRVQFPPGIRPAANVRRSTVTWGEPTRRSVVGQVPDTMLSFQGRLDNANVVRQGGVVAAPHMVPLRVSEIVRCTALAIRRRTQLMGPACQHDPLTANIVRALSTRPAPPNHWSQGWVDALLGFAYRSAGKHEQAAERLRQSIVLAEGFDHILTPMVLLESGKLALAQGQPDAAANFFIEATYVAEYFDQADVIEEAFRDAATAYLVSNQPGVYAPLIPAAAWARRKNLNALSASLLLSTSEHLIYQGDAARAEALLRDARSALGRRQMKEGRIGARYQYQLALLQYEMGRVAQGDTALNAAMTFQRKSSLRLFHISLVDQLFQKKSITPRTASKLFETVLREPNSDDWTLDPMETLSVIMNPDFAPWLNWFHIALDNKQYDQAIYISDRIRRRRFYASLPHGGRLLALRWVLEAPHEWLGENALLQRQDILVKYPVYQDLSMQAAAVRRSIQKQLPAPAPGEEARSLASEFETLARTSAKQEVMLRRLAVRREPSEFAFPPLRSVPDIQQGLQQGQVVLAFFAAGRQMYAFSLSRTKYSQWIVPSINEVQKLITSMLREMGNYDKNSQVKAEQLQSVKWQTPASRLLELIVKDLRHGVWDEYDELIVVPDGVLWYLPFEALPVEHNGEVRPLISQIRVRYAPTVSLIHPRPRGRRRTGQIAIVPGKLHSRDEDETAQNAANGLITSHRGAFPLKTPLLAPTRFQTPFWDQLIVLHDVEDTKHLPYNWTPTQLERGRAGNVLADWFELPWGAPGRILLPGFHTSAEDSLKRRGRADGSEVFLTVCGMMSAGTKTILLNRWRTGGQTSYDLVREFAQELPFTDASSAWQRSVHLAMQAEIDPSLEPRLRWDKDDPPLTASHPFFWAGPMVIDTGSQPPAPTDKDEANALPVKQVRAR